MSLEKREQEWWVYYYHFIDPRLCSKRLQNFILNEVGLDLFLEELV